VLHLLYSRFWHKVLFDLGFVSTDEPYKKLFNQGMILAFAYETASGAKVTSDQVVEKEGAYFHAVTGEPLNQIVAKMSKSLKNVVNPDDVVADFGADSLRLYEMFLGPLDTAKPWDERGVKGVYNFLNRVYKFFSDYAHLREGEEDSEILKLLHATIKKVGNDIEALHFNTAISQMMIFTNLCIKKGTVTRDSAGKFLQLLAPFAPHLGEELWHQLGHPESVALSTWPSYSETMLKQESHEYPVMINGKLRFKIQLPVDMPEEKIKEEVLSHQTALKWTKGEAPKRFILVPRKIINVVV
jgi:leucyl-tRNA synthetase